jgi:hypothetical protein
MTTGPAPVCYYCGRLRPGDKPFAYCDAFPNGIPGAIFYEAGQHNQPVAGDHGLLFTLASVEQLKERGIPSPDNFRTTYGNYLAGSYEVEES